MIFGKKEKEIVQVENFDQLTEFWATTDLMIKQTVWLSGEHHKLFSQLMEKMQLVLSHGEDNVASVEEINAAINELDQMSKQSKKLLEKLAEGTNEFQKSFEETKTIFKSIESLSTEVYDSTLDAKKSNDSLKEATEQMDTVIEYIRKVTKETSLLALNASIEAARAGEHGRGFAVVASEITKLSGETDRATEEIETIVTDIRDKNKTLNEKVNTIQEKQEDLKSEINQSHAIYTKAEDSFNNAHKAIESIGSQTTIQNETIKDINMAIGNVAQNVTDTHELTLESIQLTEKLNEKNSELNEVYDDLRKESSKMKTKLTRENHNKIVIGVNPFTSPLRIKELYGPIINEIFDGKAILYVPKDYSGIDEGLNNGLIDIAWLSPFAYVKTNAACDIHPLVSPKVNNQASYIGLIISKTLTSTNAIKGKFGFVDQNSASGYIYAKAFLSQNRLHHEPVFLGSHDKVIEAVLNGTVEAGATYNEAMDFYNGNVTSLNTIYQTEPIPKDCIAFNRKSKVENIEYYKKRFLDYSSKNHANITGFIEIKDDNYNVVRQVT